MADSLVRLSEVQIELVGICNATCTYCTWDKRTVGKKIMDADLAFRMLDEAAAMKVERIRYHGLGESLLHSSLILIIEHGSQLGFDHSISTNCFNLKGPLAKSLSKIPSLSIILAVPWVMHASFVDTCIDNAARYLIGSPSPPLNRRIHIQMVCHDNARPYYHRFIDTFLPLVEHRDNAYLHLKQPVTWPNDPEPNRGFVNEELRDHPKVIWDGRQTPLSIGVGCDMPDRFLMVLADGTVVPCCVGMDEWGLGKITGERGLRDIWESPAMNEIRRKWREADTSVPCGHCKMRKDCITT